MKHYTRNRSRSHRRSRSSSSSRSRSKKSRTRKSGRTRKKTSKRCKKRSYRSGKICRKCGRKISCSQKIKTKRKTKKKRKTSAKYERCVRAVKEKQSSWCKKRNYKYDPSLKRKCTNPWAVCTVSVGRYNK